MIVNRATESVSTKVEQSLLLLNSLNHPNEKRCMDCSPSHKTGLFMKTHLFPVYSHNQVFLKALRMKMAEIVSGHIVKPNSSDSLFVFLDFCNIFIQFFA